MVRPMSQFCCGCSLIFGAYVILTANLVQNLFTIGTATSNIILKIPTFGYSSGLVQQTINAALCILGLPFIAGGYFGVWYRLETNLRLYFVYRLISFVLDLAYMVSFFALEDMCRQMPGAIKQHGAAFACGFMRITALTSVIFVLLVETYCLFVIWSLCEDLKAGGGGLGLPELLLDAKAKIRYNAPSFDDEGCYGAAGAGGGNFPVAYGAVQAPGIGGSTRIFKGRYHDTEYPPAHNSA
eukprot:TRINITY_DN24263_c0_g1_i1.p1 TRINITY_DN24263_c0_g1~~TRINITY_DN24263_c0_g1_i1.p1  ORF type:complete len:240 (-),score=66.47 TRINITY_DN24263_c0_g1_i1:116-835(-)